MNARKKAYEILIDVCINERYSNLALKEELKGFNAKDKAFITTIVYGTLQHYRYIRYQWEKYPKIIPRKEIAILIDMSVYQLLYLDKVPAYAIVNEAVEITKDLYHGKFEKFVNAILNKVVKNGRIEVNEKDIEKLAITYSLPTWIVTMWNKQYGYETMVEILKSLDRIPHVSGRVNTLKISKEEFLEKYPTYKEGKIAKDALICEGNIADTEEYKLGYITIQDESAQLVSELLDAHENDKVLDMCAAPGSKSCHIGAMMRNRGELYALDIHEHRVELIKKNARRLGIIALDALCLDATHLDEKFDKEYFDKILLDGPCSGYGVISRKPDIRYTMKPEDMDGCIKIQKELLDSSVEYLKVDGILVYSTCTLNKKENEKQIEAFISRHPNFELLEEKTIFPYMYDSDGFYMAKLKKIS